MAVLLRASDFPENRHFEIVEGDLTLEAVDAIVNAANSRLQHGGGIARAIVQRGGWEIQAASNAWVREHGPVCHDSPAHTTAGKLPCRFVIHTVGPVWGEGDEDLKLETAVLAALQLSNALSLESLSLPAISTGIFGFPKERAAKILFRTIKNYLSEEKSTLRLVRLVLFDKPTQNAFLAVWDENAAR